jgi:hypothetical protein
MCRLRVNIANYFAAAAALPLVHSCASPRPIRSVSAMDSRLPGGSATVGNGNSLLGLVGSF